MSGATVENLARYDGRRLLGTLRITHRDGKAPLVKAADATGAKLGTFKSRKAALAAIDRASAKGGQP